MTGAGHFLTRMTLFVVAVAGLAVFTLDILQAAFVHNPGLNGVILGATLLGILFIFRQVFVLKREVQWLERFQRGQSAAGAPSPRLLAPMSAMIGDRRGKLTLSPTATRSLLDTIGARLDESREISRYLIGLMILLGLLGTFWGLMQTVGSVGDVVGRLTMTGDPVAAFDDLKRGLGSPLSAMGTAFSSSLFGLAGSLVLGFLDIQAGQAQNRFYNELEEWLSTQTRLGGGGPVGDGEASVPAYIQALLEQTADSLDSLQRIMARGEESRIAANADIRILAEKLTLLSDQMRAEQPLLLRLAESQQDMKPILNRLADAMASGAMGGDEASRGHLRNLDRQLTRMIEDQAQGRQQVIQEVRTEIRLLARTIAALAEETDRT
ncbi:MAG: flagellar motor protein MotA [Elsteraceae bacterium]